MCFVVTLNRVVDIVTAGVIQCRDNAKFILPIILQETSNCCLGIPYCWERQDKYMVVLNRKALVEREDENEFFYCA
jgi:hypothetical protein